MYSVGEPVPVFCDGVVTKIGYPYDPLGNKGHARYVEVSDAGGALCRYFYVEPVVEVGHLLQEGEILGTCQDLNTMYPGITNHVHFEILLYVKRRKVFLNPIQYLTALGHDVRG